MFRFPGICSGIRRQGFTSMPDDDAAEDDVAELGCGERYTSGGLSNIANSSLESRVFRLEDFFYQGRLGRK